MSLDSYISSNRARAEQAYQNASRGSGLNPEYISTVQGQKPKDYEEGTGIAFGSYPVGDGLVQKVQWNESTDSWEDFGDPLLTAPNGSPSTPSAVEAGKILAVDGNNNTKIIDPNESKWGSEEDAIQEAINGSDTSNTSQTDWNGANQNSGDTVILGRNVVKGGYDASSITFDASVLMEVDGQRGVGYNVVAYGAAGDNSNDDHPAFQAAHDQAKTRMATIYSRGKRTRLFVPNSTDGGYLLGDEWHITVSEVEVVGPGMYGSAISPHPSYDPTQSEAIVRVGDGAQGSPSETSSIYLHDLNIVGKGKEISGLTLNFWFSGFVHNCRMIAGPYNNDGIGRDTAGLHVRSGKNLWTAQCQTATSGGYGVLVDDRGASGNSHNQEFVIRDYLISENAEGGIRIKNGSFDTRIIGCRLGANGGNSHSGHPDVDILIEGGFSTKIVNNTFSGSKHAVVNLQGTRQVFKTENNFFKGVSGQVIVDSAGSNDHSIHHENTFKECGTDHVDGGAINRDYRNSDHVADIHIGAPFSGVLSVKDNVHLPDNSANIGDKFSAILSAQGTFTGGSIDDTPDTYHVVEGNVPNDNGYQTRTGAVLHRGEREIIDYESVRLNGRVEDSYTGDGTTGRSITLGFRPSKVLVENRSSGSLFEVRDDGLSPIDGSTPSGTLSITDNGFEIGDNGADEDPNTDTQAYDYVAYE